MINVGVHDQLLAARLCAAFAADDLEQLRLVLRDVTRSTSPGGAAAVMLATAAGFVDLARRIDPEEYQELLQQTVAGLALLVEQDGP